MDLFGKSPKSVRNRRAAALVPVLTGLLVIAGPSIPAHAEFQCTLEAHGALPSGDTFHGDVTGNDTATGRWFHVAPSAGAALVSVTVDRVTCFIDGLSLGVIEGSGRWGSQAVDFDVRLIDSVPDLYDIRIFDALGGILYEAVDIPVRGDISITES